MIGFIALVGAYLTKGQIIPGFIKYKLLVKINLGSFFVYFVIDIKLFSFLVEIWIIPFRKKQYAHN